ncbi:MAG: hypothetical protein HC837_07840 [Chloroflexaceae bacterium]|nr:hypothetical protein [Chloroflexaceae bacterium]
MLSLIIWYWHLMTLLVRLLRTHLAVVHEGTPDPGQPYIIADITLAQAFYARLSAGMADYYRFEVAPDTCMTLSMLVPVRHYQAGFRPVIALHGPGLSPDGFILPSTDEGMRAGTTLYQRTQRANPLLDGGQYLMTVHSDTDGVYCLCVGQREPQEYADAATKARVQALLES